MKNFFTIYKIVSLIALMLLMTNFTSANPWGHRYATVQTNQNIVVDINTSFTVSIEWGEGDWTSSNFGYGLTSDGTGWTWVDLPWFQNGDGSNKRCQTSISIGIPGKYFYAYRMTKSSTTSYSIGSDIWAENSSTLSAISTISVGEFTIASGNWSSISTWNGNEVPSSSKNVGIYHDVTLNQYGEVKSLYIASGKTFTASDATPRILTIGKSVSGSSTTLSNSGTWANGTGGSTVVFTGAPGSGDAIHAISGTIAFQNITVNKTGGASNVGVSFGANSSVSGTMEIGSGGFVSTAPPANFYGSSAILKFNQGSGATYDVNSGDFTWSTSQVPNNITISSGTVNLNNTRTAIGDLIIDGGSLIVSAGQALTVGGTLTNNTSNGIVLKSPSGSGAPGSLKTDGAISFTGSGSLKAERFIPAYTSNLDGWHLISSPVSSPPISLATNLTPGESDDFYFYNEPTYEWLNQKVTKNNITTMANGTGYLVSYATNSTKYITGTPNNEAVTLSNLSYTDATSLAGRGWHIAGNPYPCAIKWNNGSYTFTNVSRVAKKMSNTGSFSDINANDTISAMQGFYIQVSGSENTLTIPLTARIHGKANWYKSIENNGILLAANDLETKMSQDSWVRLNEQASEGFDFEFDSHFLPLYAPKFYSKVGDELLSTNSLPSLTAESIILFGFVKNESTQFSIELKQNIDGYTPYLKDLKTNTIQNLAENPVYNFTSEAGDDPNRFELRFMTPTGLDKTSTQSTLRVYTTNGKINISGVEGKAEVFVRNIVGQVFLRNSVNGSTLQSLNTSNLPAGIYMVSVVSATKTVSQKVVVK